MKSTGFNTWDVRGMNYLVNPCFGISVIIATFNYEEKRFIYRYGFDVGRKPDNINLHKKHIDVGVGKVLQVSDRADGICYGEVVLQEDVNKYRLEFSSFQGNDLLIKLDQADANSPLVNSFIILNSKVKIKADTPFFSYKLGDVRLNVRMNFKTDAIGSYSSIQNARHYLESTCSLNLSTNPNKTFIVKIPPDIPRVYLALFLNKQGEKFLDLKAVIQDADSILKKQKKMVDNSNKKLNVELNNNLNPLPAIRSVVYWNRVLNPLTNEDYVVINREWVEMISNLFDLKEKTGPLIFNWDTAFIALVTSYFNEELSRRLIYQLISLQEENGRLPSFQIGEHKSDRSAPPILFLTCWFYYLRTYEKDFLEKVYYPLKKWYNWFKKNRDRKKSGIFRWGIDVLDKDQKIYVPDKYGAFYESGMDDAPLWDFAEIDPEFNNLNLATTDINSYMAICAKTLYFIAETLGIETDKEIFRKEFEIIAHNIEEFFFYNKEMSYLNRFDDGRFLKIYTPIVFFPLMTGKLEYDKAMHLIKEKLFNSDYFENLFMIPSTAKNDIFYNPDGDYWRGRVWPPLNYLTYFAVQNYSSYHAGLIAKKSLELFMREWQNSCHIHENYSALTGAGEPTSGTFARSCPFYTWGALLGYIILEDLLGPELYGGIKFGWLFDDLLPLKIEGVKLHGKSYSLVMDKQMTALYGGTECLFLADKPVKVRNFIKERNFIKFTILGDGNTNLSFSTHYGHQFEINIRTGISIKKEYVEINDNEPLKFELFLKKDFPLSIGIFPASKHRKA